MSGEGKTRPRCKDARRVQQPRTALAQNGELLPRAHYVRVRVKRQPLERASTVSVVSDLVVRFLDLDYHRPLLALVSLWRISGLCIG